MAFVRRKIVLDFILGTGYFGTQGSTSIEIPDPAAAKNTVTLEGLRVQAHVKNIGGIALGEAQVKVYGLPPSLLQQLSSISQIAMFQRDNRVIISAGDDESGVSVIYEGTINQAWADMSSPPDSVLHIGATAGGFYLAKPVRPFSAPSANAATIMQSLAVQMGYNFENSGVSVILSTPYYAGTLMAQARECAAEANIDFGIDGNVLYIVPKGKSRRRAIVLISPETGMIGYPAHDGTGIVATTLFNRDIQIMNTVEVQSSLTNANGQWLVIGVSHDLESETPGGEWYTHFQGASLDNPNALPSLK